MNHCNPHKRTIVGLVIMSSEVNPVIQHIQHIEIIDKFIIRIFLLLFSPLRWLFSFLKSQPPSIAVECIKDPREEYVNTRKTDFLRTFETDVIDWNVNVPDVMRDQAALAETLQDADNEIEKKWKRSLLIESTPRGNVVMFYDAYKQSFSYYCDQAVMPYDIMNAVAMKYVLTFYCRDFFIDSTILPKLDKVESAKKTTDAPIEPSAMPLLEKSQPFAKFKSYNTATNKAVSVTREADKIINRFLHLGPVRNWIPITKRVKMNPLNGFKTDMIPSNQKLSYQEYKRLQQMGSAK